MWMFKSENLFAYGFYGFKYCQRMCLFGLVVLVVTLPFRAISGVRFMYRVQSKFLVSILWGQWMYDAYAKTAYRCSEVKKDLKSWLNHNHNANNNHHLFSFWPNKIFMYKNWKCCLLEHQHRIWSIWEEKNDLFDIIRTTIETKIKTKSRQGSK